MRGTGGVGRSKRLTRGLTLLEMLVVFLLVTLLGTLLMQGFGFFLANYDAVGRAHREASVDTRLQHWFASTVAGMVPYRQQDRRSFAGDATSFRGVTLQPLGERSGFPVRVRWFIDPEVAPSVVVYEEESLMPGVDGVRWPLLAAQGEPLSFQYADADNRWHVAWPPSGTGDRIPGMISLVSETGAVVWLARTQLYPVPVQHFGEPL